MTMIDLTMFYVHCEYYILVNVYDGNVILVYWECNQISYVTKYNVLGIFVCIGIVSSDKGKYIE